MKKIIKNEDRKNRVYGVIGLVALFLVGTIFGYIINGSDRVNHSNMSEKDCVEIQNQIMHMVRNVGVYDAQKIAQLDKIFSENCNNRDFRKNAPQPQPRPVEEEKLPSATCEAIEKLLKNELADENSLNASDHEYNAKVYQNLAFQGCEKNREKYENNVRRERGIAKALQENHKILVRDEYISTCKEIENLLQNRLNECDLDRADCRIGRAQIYANLSERGCAENSEKYKELAAQELEIARALTDDNVSQNQNEATEMVETYKRLHMQQEAAKMLEKAKKLTNPAIDFIIQLEKIIEE